MYVDNDHMPLLILKSVGQRSRTKRLLDILSGKINKTLKTLTN
jgi:hypothetical protein